jgi:hypothetical protein
MTEIYINTELIELYSDETIVMSYAVNNLFEIESRQGSYSNTFKIPATKKNNLILGFSNNVLSVSDLPYLKIPCLIYTDGLLQVEGIAEIITASRSEYEIRILSGNSNWFELIADKNIQSALLHCDYSYFWTEAFTTGSRANLWPDVFICPNIDYGEIFFNPIAGPPFNVNWFQLYPAIYAKYLFKKIFDDVGLSIESDWFDNDPLFEKQIIPFSAQFSRSENTELRNKLKSTASVDFAPPSSVFAPNGDKFHIFDTNETSCYPYVNQVNWIDPFGIPFFNINAGKGWLFMDSVKVKLKYNITVDRLFNTAFFDASQLSYYDENGTQQYYPIYNLVSQPVGIYNFQGEIDITIGRGAVAFSTETNAIWKAGSTIEIVSFELTGDVGALVVDPIFNWLELGATLPDVTQSDFILSIANQYGLIFEQSPLSNTVKIFQFGKVIGNIPNAIDWSKKLDLSEDYSISFTSDNYSRNNYFQYAPDDTDEYLSRQINYGRGSFIVNAAAINTEQVIFESVFSPVIRLFSYNGPSGFGGVVPLAYIPVNEGSTFTVVNGRFAYVDFDTSAELTIQPSGFFTSPQPNVYFEDLIFENLLDKYYPLLSSTINSNKAVTCLIRLNNLDVNQLDFSRPIWIDYFGAYFYINEITQYKVNEKDSTQITLIIIQN